MSIKTLPQGPAGHPLLGTLRDFQRDQLAFYASCAHDYGDVVPTRFGPVRVLLIYHPDAIEEVLVARNRDFVKSPGVRLLRPLLGEGLLRSEGSVWLRQRRLVQPAFHRQRLADYGEIMTAYTERRLPDWKDSQVVDVHAEMMALTLEIVAKTLFDADVSNQTGSVGHAANVLAEHFGARLRSFRLLPHWVPTPANLRSAQAIRRLDQVIYGMIATRRSSGEDRGDLLSILLHAQDADDGTGMTDRQVRDEAMTLFMAGHETTAVALSWTWYLLGQHPQVEARVAEEVRAVLGGRAPAMADLPNLTYTARVVTESMRLYSPVYVMGRQAARPTEVAGYPVARNVVVVMPTWIVHRDARWFDEPEAFRPERWADERARPLPRFAYFPFGGGPRQCIGNAFAMMEAVLVLATIAQRCRLTLLPGQRVTPTPYVTLRPEPGIRMVVARR
jgi:cytochrome P450